MFHPNRYINLLFKVAFLVLDLLWFRKDPKLWVIAIPETDRFDGNVRAIYELYRSNPEIIAPAQIQIILARTNDDTVAAGNYVLWGSWAHFSTLLRAGCILYHHNYNDVGLIALPLRRWNFRVSHGIHFKRVERAQAVPGFFSRVLLSTRNTIPHHLVSSRLDALSAVAYFHLYLPRVLVTGAAKNDILIADKLPKYYGRQQDRLNAILDGRRLITYAPTWRNNGESYQFNPVEVAQLKDFLTANNAVFGIAGHAYLRERYVPAGSDFLDLNALGIDIQVILRCTDTLISDYSSIWIDFLLKEKPIILFQYDAEYYTSDRDFLFDTSLFSPSTKCHDFDILIQFLAQPPGTENGFLKRAFHQFEDGQNGKRVLKNIKSMVAP